jgi:hypothetical protein
MNASLVEDSTIIFGKTAAPIKRCVHEKNDRLLWLSRQAQVAVPHTR